MSVACEKSLVAHVHFEDNCNEHSSNSIQKSLTCPKGQSASVLTPSWLANGSHHVVQLFPVQARATLDETGLLLLWEWCYVSHSVEECRWETCFAGVVGLRVPGVVVCRREDVAEDDQCVCASSFMYSS